MKSFHPALQVFLIISQSAVSDEPIQHLSTQEMLANGWEHMQGPILGIIAIVVLNGLMIWLAIGLRRRIQAIAEPNPDQKKENTSADDTVSSTHPESAGAPPAGGSIVAVGEEDAIAPLARGRKDVII